jgi:hypothetical protein
MGLGIHAVFDQSGVPESESQGEALAAALEWLDEVTEREGILGFGDFVSHPDGDVPEDFDGSPDELEALWAELPATWHRATDGRIAIQAMRDAAQRAPRPGDDEGYDPFEVDEVIEELNALDDQLAQAERLGVRFQITID